MTKVAERSALSHQAAPPPRTGPGDKTCRVRGGGGGVCSVTAGSKCVLLNTVGEARCVVCGLGVGPKRTMDGAPTSEFKSRVLVRPRIPSCSLRHYFRGGCRSPIICGCSRELCRRPKGALASHLPRLQVPPGTQGVRNASSFDPGLLGLAPASPGSS